MTLLDIQRVAFGRFRSVVALTLAFVLIGLTFALTSVDRDALVETTAATPAPSLAETAAADVPAVTDEALWLARVIYSETKRPYEQELVAWVVRNRVETQYRGAATYRDVVLDPWQFSAFNRNAPKRTHYMGLGEHSTAAGWQTALSIAQDVLNAPAYERPFALTTRHFYSEQSMVGRSHPAWANGKRPVALDRPVEPRRFRFYANIS